MSKKLEVRDEKLITMGVMGGVEFCRMMARELAPADGVVGITIKRPDPVLNLVVHTDIEEKDADQKIKTVVDFYQKNAVAWTWVINPISKPDNLARYLEQNNFAYLEEYPSLYYDLSKRIPEKIFNKYDIREAKPEDQLREWIKPISEGFPSSDKGEGFREVNAGLPHGPGTSLRQIMIFDRNQVVTAGTLFLNKEAAMIYNIATRTSARRKGLGTILTVYMMQEAKRLGYQHCFLDSTTSGFNLYHNLGFKVYANNKVYALKSLIRRR